MIDEVRIAFTALRAQQRPQGHDLAVLPIDSVDGVFVGIDEQSQQHLLLHSVSGAAPVTEVATLAVTMRNLVIAGIETTVLDVVCLLESLVEVFDHFVVAVIERVSHNEDADVAVETVLRRWRQFLVASAQQPRREKLAAILGELLVVADAVHASGVPGIEFWVGPFGSRHDIRRDGTAIEVKTTRSHTGHRVTIHGEDQLLGPQGGALYLHLVRLEEVHGGGRSVTSLVDELLAAGVSAERLFEALTAAGLNVVDLPAIAEVTFDVRERLTLLVDDHTPRIVPASFAGGQRPIGVVDLTYVIDLNSQLDRALGDASYEKLMRTIGSGHAA
ncbi:hypothetical protein C1Y40_04691 [Mycobacterium talmoniae]|uniref:PD-(D/E)XK motif protein n=1 Tax=Mycobacterium talmoniae TaxID=1858794 RepID=A0A2S8BEQ7_9MYCO|nr:PD-(D/E)XK motif protein [Mycobacterium eburneum]PQM45150.1 hypothetical protein C1Y40_04691 [Mycobacterium talmoniae]TDH46678.1 PD-(D/E)XK motif protein [Mycobacterium eburneum]